MKTRICIEACIASEEDAIAAYKGGADRLELNMALSLDGLTPSLGLLRRVKAAVPLPVIVMVRPRPFNFVYSAAEFAVMQYDIDAFLQEGIAGCAVGILEADYSIDTVRIQRLSKQLNGVDIVFHRAFDITPNATEALETLVDLGITRVLTSGHQPTAPQGSEQLRRLRNQARQRIEILPGSGIKPTNVVSLLSTTGCDQIHGTFRSPSPKNKMHGLEALKAAPLPGTSQKVVAEVRKIVDKIED